MAETPPQIFDHDLYRLRRARIKNPEKFLLNEAQERLNDRLLDIRRSFKNPLVLNEIPDNETLPCTSQSHDLVISNLCLHRANDLPGLLAQIRHSLKPDGFFLGALFGGETLKELRSALSAAELSVRGGVSPRVVPFASLYDMAGLLQRAGFALPVADHEIITVSYPDIFRLMHDLRNMGETNILRRRSRLPLTRRILDETAALYKKSFAEKGGRLTATFEIIFLAGWAPHESQQKPLKRGSAEHSLTKALSDGA